jgi:hypothetical protein
MFDLDYFSVAEVAKKLRKSKQTIYRWMDKGYDGVILKSSRLAGTRMIRPYDLDAFLHSVHKENPYKDDNDGYRKAMDYLMSLRKKKR